MHRPFGCYGRHTAIGLSAYIFKSSHLQKRLDEVALHSERIDEVPYWELAELPEFVVGGILARVGLADKIGQEAGGFENASYPATASGLMAETSNRRAGTSPRGKAAASIAAAGAALGAGGSTNSAILEAFLRLSDAAQLHHLRGVGGAGAAGVVSAAAAAAAAAQQKMLRSARQKPWRPNRPFGKAFSRYEGVKNPHFMV